METREFLLSTHAKLQGLRVARNAYASQFAPDFNLINLLAPGEVKLSVLLRELLDPNGSHAQGRKFLDLFIQQLKLPDWASNRKVLSVATEVLTDSIEKSDRRIDILIELASHADGRKLAIAIENKPWAADGERQIADYLDHLFHRYSDGHILIYLPGYENGVPEVHSITENEMRTALSERRLSMSCYAQLLPWLASCRTECAAPSVHAFLLSFEQYIRQTFLGVLDMTEREQLISEATRTPQAVEISLELSLAHTAIKQSLINQLEIQLRQGIEKIGHGWNLLGGVDITFDYGGFLIQLGQGDQYVVSFECENKGGGNFSYGICKKSNTDEDLPDVRNALNREFNLIGKSTDWWPWFLPFDNALTDWRNSIKPWVQIASGEMASWMLGIVEKIETALTNERIKSRLAGNGTRFER